MDFNELAVSRRSIRAYLNKEVPEELIIKILEAAQAAPSGGNRQPWYFYVIRDKSVMDDIHDKSSKQGFFKEAPVMIIVCAEAERSAERYGERGAALYCIQDTAAAIQNILLCAHNLGLGTCWCGAFDETALSEVLSLDKKQRPIAIIPLGYPANDTGVMSGPKRRPLNEIVTFIGKGSGIGNTDEQDKRTKFEHLDMSGALFNDVNLAFSEFNNINLHKAGYFDANMTEATFNELNLSGSQFGSLNMENAAFDNLSLKDSKIINCDLSGVKIIDCKTDGMSINGNKI